MNTGWTKNIGRFLIALMIWAPYQLASAGMIATDQATATADRAALVNFFSRAEVAAQLQALGVDPVSAKQRVAAMTDQEARALAGEIANAPAGGVYGEGIVFIILVVLIAYAWYKHRNPY
jgi:hypothetical protein